MRRFLLASSSVLALCVGVGSAWASPSPVTFDYTGSLQTYTVQTSGMYEIEALGAEGGLEYYRFRSDAYGGAGADITGQFALQASEQLAIVVGHHGYNGASGFAQYGAGGGGGGTFVVGPGDTPLLIAGGGGGGGSASGAHGVDAVDATSGTSGNGKGAGTGGAGGAGGQGGNPGYLKTPTGEDLFGGAGGGGLTGYGSQGFGPSTITYTVPDGGNSFTRGSAGGAGGQGNGNGNGGAGGFGGGGGGAGANLLGIGDCGGGGGGGGGYSGGGGGGYAAGGNTTYCGQGGGAGGSFNSGSNQTFKDHTSSSGNGVVTISYLGSLGSPEPVPEPASLSLFGVSSLGLLALRRRRQR